MASPDVFLRSDADKSETPPSKNLRLRADTDKGGGVTVSIAAMTSATQIAGVVRA